VRKFKLGLRRLCARQVWESVETRVDRKTHEDLGNQFEIARPDVTKGIDYGTLSLENLLIILSCLDWEYGDLPELPSHEQRCFAGYAEAIGSVIGKSRRERRDGPIVFEAFIATATLVGHRPFHLLAAKGTLTDEVWERVVRDIRPRIARRLGRLEEQLEWKSATDFRRLYAHWGEAVARCILAIPNRWSQWLELSA